MENYDKYELPDLADMWEELKIKRAQRMTTETIDLVDTIIDRAYSMMEGLEETGHI